MILHAQKESIFRYGGRPFGTSPILLELQHANFRQTLTGVIWYPTGMLMVCNAGYCVVWGTPSSSLSAMLFFIPQCHDISKCLSQCNLTDCLCAMSCLVGYGEHLS